MKKLLVILVAVSVLFIIGCGKDDTPLDDASEYINKSLAFDDNISLDASGLKYEVEDEVEGKTTVTVSGKIKCEGKIVFEKKDGQWVMAE